MEKSNVFPRMHVSLYVKDISKTVEFYESFFGQKVEKVMPGYAKFHLEQPSLIISFVENASKIHSSFGHLGFQVESMEDLERRIQDITGKGFQTKQEIGTACCYAVQDKIWVSDPDGYKWEVYHFHEDVEYNDPHYAIGTEKAEEPCCSPAMVTKTKVSLRELGGEKCC